MKAILFFLILQRQFIGWAFWCLSVPGVYCVQVKILLCKILEKLIWTNLEKHFEIGTFQKKCIMEEHAVFCDLREYCWFP